MKSALKRTLLFLWPRRREKLGEREELEFRKKEIPRLEPSWRFSCANPRTIPGRQPGLRLDRFIKDPKGTTNTGTF
ncbi:Hypothetical predicted protein [Marmota monax]|uniref:Uncharacterized protein n=1 Tax=Marmota monax TaxID=9995 RepID=A0A5E4A456_MARMO|nr:hypothetical protein GHT09_002543 [Marmota monax]VTJ52020.1 Hypothetical predicted protein [Marmota monax]